MRSKAITYVKVLEKLIISLVVLCYFLPAFFFSIIFLQIAINRGPQEGVLWTALCVISTFTMLIFSYRIILLNKCLRDINLLIHIIIFTGVYIATYLGPTFYVLPAIVGYIYWYGFRNSSKQKSTQFSP